MQAVGDLISLIYPPCILEPGPGVHGPDAGAGSLGEGVRVHRPHVRDPQHGNAGPGRPAGEAGVPQRDLQLPHTARYHRTQGRILNVTFSYPTRPDTTVLKVGYSM
jgi:hypothetical protein